MTVLLEPRGANQLPPVAFHPINKAMEGVPPSLLKTLDIVFPLNVGLTLLIRHAARPPIPEQGEDCVLLTEEGKAAAYSLGTFFKQWQPSRLITSTMERCSQTLSEICKGANWQVERFEQNPLFAPSGPFTVDIEQSHAEFKRIGGPALFNHQITQEIPPPGMRSTREGVNEVLQTVFSQEIKSGEFNIIVTHDAVTAVVLGYLFDCTFDEGKNWPGYLDGAFFYREGNSYKVAWREEIREIPKNFYILD